MLDFPAPLGPSMLMNMPRCWLEKGRSLIAVSRSGVRCGAAQFFRSERCPVAAGREPGEQAGRDQHVVSGAVGDQAGRYLAVQAECLDQRAELVTRLAGEQPPGKLERVEYPGALPVAKLAPQYAGINVRVVGDEHPPGERRANFMPDFREGRGAGNVGCGYPVDAGGEGRDGPWWPD